MTKTTEKENIEPVQSAEAEVSQDATPQEPVSETRMLLAPLARYGVIGLLIVGVIVTSAVMLTDEPKPVTTVATTEENVISSELAATDTAITDTVTELAVEEPVVAVDITDTTPVLATAQTVTASAETTVSEAVVATVTEPVIPEPVVTATLAAVPEISDHKVRISEFHAYIAQQDQEYLDSLKARQAERIQALQQQLVRQQQRIAEIEKRDQEIYETRAASIKRSQQAREESLNRI